MNSIEATSNLWRPGQPIWLYAAGKRLEARCWGPPPDIAPTLLLLHEGLGCVALWRDFPEHLSARTGWGVFAWSRAGYGVSDPIILPRPLDYMTREARDSLPEIMAKLALQHCVLLGHSDGASIATIYAGQAVPIETSLTGLILIAPHFFTEEIGLAAIKKARIAYQQTDLRTRLGRYHADPDNCFWGWNDAWLDPVFRAWNIEAALPGINVPVLAVQGADDQYGTLEQIDALQAGLTAPMQRMILPKCRHSPHIEAMTPLLDSVAEFVVGLNP